MKMTKVLVCSEKFKEKKTSLFVFERLSLQDKVAVKKEYKQ